MKEKSPAHSKRRLSRLSARGFTLIEMIVVIGIITVLMTIGSYGLKNFTKASGVSVAVPIAEGVFSQARALAIEKGSDARLLIHADSADHGKHLRYMLMVYRDSAGKWVAPSRGVYLPEGVFFSRIYSHTDHTDNTWGASATAFESIPQKTDLDIYGSEEATVANANLSGTYRYYQFNSQGVIGFEVPNDAATANDPSVYRASPGASFVIAVGIKPPGVNDPTVSSAGGEKNFGGFVIWKRGHTSTFKHPDQIGIPANVSNF